MSLKEKSTSAEEAIWGLTKRKDPEGIKILISRIESGKYLYGDEDAICEILNLSNIDDFEVLDLIQKLKVYLK